MEVKIDSDIHALFEGLYDEQTFKDLKKDIAKRGILNKGIVANSPEEFQGIIVCGEQRYKISQELKIDFPYNLQDFKNKEEMIELALNDNILRRNLSVAQKIKAYDNYTKWLRETRQKHATSGRSQLITPKGKTSELLAEKVGTSSATAQRALYVMNNAPKEIKEQMVKGELSISGAEKKTRKLLKKEHKKEQDELIKLNNFESGVEWCDYGINIYTGCYHNCSYCYAKAMNARFKWVENWTEPKKRDIDLKDLAKKLKNLDAGSFFFCSMCDAYQPLNNELDWAKEVLEVMLPSKHHIIILTKSANVERDFDLISQYDNVEVAFTITSLDDEQYKKYEPNSSLPSEKVRVLKKAHKMGIKTLVSIEPWILGHTDTLEIIKTLEDYVDKWIIGVANYMGFKLEEYRPYVGELLSYLIENEIKYRFKAELDRTIKSYPILSREEYESAGQQQVGDQ